MRFSYSKSEYEKHPEAIANKFTLKCMSIGLSVLCFVWMLNLLEIFTVDHNIIHTAVVCAIIIYAAGIFLWGLMDGGWNCYYGICGTYKWSL